MSYTQEEIEKLIACPKLITAPPKKEMQLERGSRRNNMRLCSDDDEFDFSIFMRYNEDFPENFSIGLNYWPNDERGSICLLRCNGPHGDFEGGPGLVYSHFLFHIHKAKPENIEAGFRPERGGEPTDAYASYEQALHYFLTVVNVVNASKYFPKTTQLKFNIEEGDLNHELPRFT